MVRASELHNDTGKLKVFVFNVGQGDHLLVQLPTGEYGVIDFHFGEYDVPPAWHYFKALISEGEKIEIAFLCISHFDTDHISGLDALIHNLRCDEIPIRAIWLSGGTDSQAITNMWLDKFNEWFRLLPSDIKRILNQDSKAYKSLTKKFFDYIKSWRQKKQQWQKEPVFKNLLYTTQIVKGQKDLKTSIEDNIVEFIGMGPLDDHVRDYQTAAFENAPLRLISKIINSRHLSIERKQTWEEFKSQNLKPLKEDKNITSHLIRFDFVHQKLLFTGDMHRKNWLECLDFYDQGRQVKGEYKSQFIKAGHHGSAGSSSPKLWKKVFDQQSSEVHLAISAGRNQKYKHPNSKFLEDVLKVEKELNAGENSFSLKKTSTNTCNSCIDKDHSEGNVEKLLAEWVTPETSNFSSDILTATQSYQDYDPDDPRTNGAVYNGDKLLAYLYEFDGNGPAEVRALITNTSKTCDCFFKEETHKVPLRDQCR